MGQLILQAHQIVAALGTLHTLELRQPPSSNQQCWCRMQNVQATIMDNALSAGWMKHTTSPASLSLATILL